MFFLPLHDSIKICSWVDAINREVGVLVSIEELFEEFHIFWIIMCSEFYWSCEIWFSVARILYTLMELNWEWYFCFWFCTLSSFWCFWFFLIGVSGFLVLSVFFRKRRRISTCSGVTTMSDKGRISWCRCGIAQGIYRTNLVMVCRSTVTESRDASAMTGSRGATDGRWWPVWTCETIINSSSRRLIGGESDSGCGFIWCHRECALYWGVVSIATDVATAVLADSRDNLGS